jgi:hypothetical protein
MQLTANYSGCVLRIARSFLSRFHSSALYNCDVCDVHAPRALSAGRTVWPEYRQQLTGL